MMKITGAFLLGLLWAVATVWVGQRTGWHGVLFGAMVGVPLGAAIGFVFLFVLGEILDGRRRH
jgi:hypothetical protein